MCSAGANNLDTNNYKGAATSAGVNQSNKSETKKTKRQNKWSVVKVVGQQ